MRIKLTYALWGVLFVICGCLGFVQGAMGLGRLLLRLSSLIFFIPGVLLLCWGQRKQVRIISLSSLGITLLLMIVNLLCARGSILLGNVLNAVLVILSSPMYCSQFPALSLFLWACLLMATFLNPSKK